MEKYYTELSFGSVHVLVAITLFCSLPVWSQRVDGQRSRRFLAWTWFLLLFISIVKLVKVNHQIDRDFEGVLADAVEVTQAQIAALIESMNDGEFDDCVAEFRYLNE